MCIKNYKMFNNNKTKLCLTHKSLISILFFIIILFNHQYLVHSIGSLIKMLNCEFKVVHHPIQYILI
jgi:hypothetical protein